MANPSAFVFPDDFDSGKCAVVAIPVALIPLVWGALEPLQQRDRWQSEADWKRGYSAIAALGACMMACCMDELIKSNDRIYRLLDTSLNGAVYTVSGDGTPASPHVYNPQIPLVPLATAGEEPSLQFAAAKTMRLVDNLTNATTYADAPDDRNFRQQLEDLIAAISAQDDLDPEMLARLTQILAALA